MVSAFFVQLNTPIPHVSNCGNNSSSDFRRTSATPPRMNMPSFTRRRESRVGYFQNSCCEGNLSGVSLSELRSVAAPLIVLILILVLFLGRSNRRTPPNKWVNESLREGVPPPP